MFTITITDLNNIANKPTVLYTDKVFISIGKVLMAMLSVYRSKVVKFSFDPFSYVQNGKQGGILKMDDIGILRIQVEETPTLPEGELQGAF
jgi:hypothetical protein